MNIKLKNTITLGVSTLFMLQLIGCTPNKNQEKYHELKIEEKQQINNAIQQEQEEEQINKQKKLQNKIEQMENDLTSIIQYILVYDLKSECEKIDNDIKYIPFKENTLSYSKINNFKEDLSKYDETLQNYASIYIEYLEQIQSIVVDMMKDLSESRKKNNVISATSFEHINKEYSKKIEGIKIKYNEKLNSYYEEEMLNYQTQNNVTITKPNVLISNSFYKAYLSLENLFSNSN